MYDINPKNLNLLMIEKKNENKLQNLFINYNLPYLNDIIDGSQGGYLRTDLI